MKSRSWILMSLCSLMLSLGCSGTSNNTPSEAGTTKSGFFQSARYSLPANTPVQVSLGTSLTSGSAAVGQEINGRVAANVLVGGHVVIPAGSQVTGTVTAVKPAKRFGGQAMVAVGFDSVTLPGGDEIPIAGSMVAYARKETARDTGAIVGGTLGGALLGKVLGHDTKHAVAGAVVGGGVGTAVASRRGDEAYLQAGVNTTAQTRSAIELPAI